ncbi:Tm-1-like ATP-binding domain-containing protein [Propylenella binzhouense]|uniref:UPF0261 family protein n=1 Tax=Propylenella binzhouense TaxID=2555902 RepID=A0A964T4W3_9HYPH|nr:Tm-1-like ATP-binding domain-containing protein [Propylenella binzhouense]MYZ48450.1 UPF0261 family protein [Propylenella binzhouense]
MAGHGSPPAPVAIVGALDTKAEEVLLVRDECRKLGLPTLVFDTGILGEPGCASDIGRAAIAEAGGTPLAALIRERHSGRALAVMSAGLGKILGAMAASSEVAAVLGIGGSRGTVMAAGAMRSLPLGMPKIIVTPSLIGNVRQLVGSSDVVLVPTVADLLGVNRITRPVLQRSVRMLAAWLGFEDPAPARGRTVALTSFGVTTPCVSEVRRLLLSMGTDVVVFPANGIGGPAMERLAEQGAIQGIIDITTHEIADTLCGGTCRTDGLRYGLAALGKIPRVISLGALDFVNFTTGAVPARFAQRLLYEHSSAVTLMRTDRAESGECGSILASRLGESGGRYAIVMPGNGFSEYDRPGGPFWLPEADRACMDAILDAPPGPDGTVVATDMHINEAGFARRLVDEYTRLSDGVAA